MGLNKLDLSSVWVGWLLLPPKKHAPLGRKVTESDLSRAAQERRKQMYSVLLLLQEHAPDLLAGKPGSKLSVRKREKLVDLIHHDSASEMIFKQRMHFFVKGILLGRQQHIWKINPPAPPLLSKSYASMVTLNAVSNRHRLNTLRSWFLESLDRIDSLDAEIRRGQLVFSMVIYGGVFNSHKLVALCQAINNNRIHNDTGSCWARLLYEGERDRSQTWFTDPLSEALLYKWMEFATPAAGQNIPFIEAESLSREVWRVLKAFLRSIQAYDYTLPSSLGEFLDLARSGVVLELTPVLIGYAGGNRICESLPPQAWLRLRQNCRLKVDTNDQHVIIKKCKEIKPLPNIKTVTKPAKNQGKFKRALYRLISPGEKSDLYNWSRNKRALLLEEWIENNKSDMSPITALISNWALFLLRYEKSEADRGIGTYISRIARLYDICGEHSLPDLEEEELMEIYELFVMKLKGLKSRGEYCSVLKRFHGFLMREYSAPEVDFSLIDGFTNAEGSVDANLITLQEYERLKSLLAYEMKRAKGDLQKRTHLIQLLVLILGFRCGLRASEARKIRVMDVCLSRTKPELLIRNSTFSRLKTSNGVRQIPLSCFLEKDEIELLTRWHKNRCTEVFKKKDRPLFTLYWDDQYAIASQAVFPHLNDLMRVMTGDKSLHFHHLRHSFASWTLLRMIGPDYSQILESNIAKDNGVTACRDLSVALTGEKHPGSKMMYALARLMGHASPAETMRSYIHLFDWILGKAVQRITPELTLTAAKAVFVINDSRIYRSLKKRTQKNINATMLIHNQRKRFMPQLKDETENLATSHQPVRIHQVASMISDIVKQRQCALYMWELMHISRNNNGSWKQIPDSYSVDMRYLKKWIDAALLIANIRTRSIKACLKEWIRHDGERCGQIKMTRPMVNGAATRLKPLPFLKNLNTEEFKRLMSASESIPKKHHGLLMECVFGHIKHAPVEGSELRFHRVSKARKYIKFLKLLGIEDHRIKALHYPSSAARANPKTQQTQMDYWRQKLNLPPGFIMEKDRSAVRESGRHGWVGIIVTHSQEGSLKQRQTCRRVSSYAFKVAILTLAVQCIITSPESALEYLYGTNV